MQATLRTAGSLPSSIIAIHFLLLAALGFAPDAAGAAGQRFTLAEAVKTALEQNHQLKAQERALTAKQEDVGVARSFLLPKVTIEERYLRTVNPGYAFMTRLNQQRIEANDFAPESLNHPDAVNDFQSTISIEQPLYARKSAVGLEISKREREASQEELWRKREDTAFMVIQYYLSVGTAGEYVRTAGKALEDAQEHRRIAEVRYNTGLGLYSEVLRAATALLEAEQRLVSVRKNMSVAKQALGLIMGLAEAVEISGPSITLPAREIDDLEEQALSRRDIKSLEIRKENARNQVKLAQAGLFPLLGVGGQYQLNDHNTPLGAEGDSWQLMAFLRWEAFDGLKRVHERRKAQQQVMEAEEYLAGMKKMILFRVREAYLAVEEAKKNVELAKEAVKTAEEGRRLTKARYEASLSPLVDLLDAQTSTDHAQANLVAKENDYRLALARLSHESGLILKDLQIE